MRIVGEHGPELFIPDRPGRIYPPRSSEGGAMNDYFLSLIRTWVPIAIGAALSWLAVRFGLGVDEDTQAQLAIALTAVVTAAYYALVRALEKRYPWIGKVLLGLGAAAKPVYVEPPR